MQDLWIDPADVWVGHFWKHWRWRAARPFRRAWHRWKYRGVDAALVKATYDDFSYAMGLKNGQVIEFGSATLCRPFVYLQEIRSTTIKGLEHDDQGQYPSSDFDRGIYIRLSEIAWCADAPHGS